MGAIYGYTGPIDRTLRDRIDAVLRHRGSEGVMLAEAATGTLGYRARHDAATRIRFGSGLFAEDDCAIAVAGCVTAPTPHERLLPDLLQSYREHGPAFVKSLNGAFVIAVRDGSTIHLFRDGAGQRTVYYGCHNGRFIFAVEPKGVLAVPGFPRRLRPGAVAQYLTFSFVPGAATMLQDLQELPAGHWVSCDGTGAPELHRHFRFEDAAAEDLSEDDWVERFRSEFADAVTRRLPDDDDVGLFLSGGVDSSVVAAELVRQRGPGLRTYAIHFGKDTPNELEFASAVARRLGTDHHEVQMTPRDFLPRLRQMIWHLDDPIGDPITMPNYELAARAAQDVRWIFNGEGGDPLFGGPKNIPMMLHHWYGGIDRDPHFRERAYLASYRRCYDDLARLLTPEWRAQYDEAAELQDVLTPFFTCARPAGLLDKLAAINIRLKGAHLILPKVERMTAAWGLTVMSPLFDPKLIELSFRMPSTLKLRRGIEKVILKRAYQDALPAEIIARPKSGMRVPVHYWFQTAMKRYAKKLLSPRELRRTGIFDPARVKQLLAYDTEEGPGRYGLKLWMLMTFEIWRRIVVDGEPV